MMTPSSKRPTERPPPHSRSAWQNIWVGLLVFVVGSGLVWVLQSVFFGGDPSEVNVEEPGEVNVNEPGEVNVNEPGEVNVEEPGEVIISGPATVIIEQPAATEPPEPPEPTPEPTAGDCDRFPVYAQGRWPPMGTAVRSEPTRAAPQTDSVQPNVIISVDGWVRSDAPYPTNPAPWNENVWFRLTDRSGWVSFAGVRASPSHADGTEGGGQPVELIDECELRDGYG